MNVWLINDIFFHNIGASKDNERLKRQPFIFPTQNKAPRKAICGLCFISGGLQAIRCR
ncbi:hypothetical protein SD77_1065 [Bacillus badius]|uniref:Ribose 5-phosphate isomerase B n=1 Tax=Bacillus badius TaxID=1455 RepID=A0ABR5ASK7_BACBA|nr:hypothetical protein SD78_2673 [Bacillus badius]KIL77736.1 hypothetical protein SD77_1065 [Bacillus badius]